MSGNSQSYPAVQTEPTEPRIASSYHIPGPVPSTLVTMKPKPYRNHQGQNQTTSSHIMASLWSRAMGTITRSLHQSLPLDLTDAYDFRPLINEDGDQEHGEREFRGRRRRTHHRRTRRQ